jgi:hypothetical protein
LATDGGENHGVSAVWFISTSWERKDQDLRKKESLVEMNSQDPLLIQLCKSTNETEMHRENGQNSQSK